MLNKEMVLWSHLEQKTMPHGPTAWLRWLTDETAEAVWGSAPATFGDSFKDVLRAQAQRIAQGTPHTTNRILFLMERIAEVRFHVLDQDEDYRCWETWGEADALAAYKDSREF